MSGTNSETNETSSIDDTSQPKLNCDPSLQVTQPSQRALVRVLAFAHRNRVDPAVFIDQLATEYSGRAGSGLRQFAMLVRNGVPIIDALEQTPAALDRSAVMAIRLASETGTLTSIYAALLGNVAPLPVNTSEHGRTLYVASTPKVIGPSGERPANEYQVEWIHFFFSILLAWLIVAFLDSFILPTLEHIFDEFAMSQPLALRWLTTVSQFSPIAILITFALFTSWLVLRSSIRLRNWRTKWPFRIWEPDQTPVSASLLSLLAIVMESGRPIAAGLESLAKYHHIPKVRQRISLARQSMLQGESSWDSLATYQLITREEANALAGASDPRTQAWLLRWLTSSRKSQSTLRSQWLLRGLSMIVLLLLAAIVLLAAIAVFISMNSLIVGLS